jgi:hypothetical protein
MAETNSSDLKSAETNKFVNLDPISSDDLLDVHQYLKKTKGNFNDDFKTALASPSKVKKSSKRG